MREKLTFSELFGLFGHELDDARAISFADATEYLAVVTYLVGRTGRL